METFFLHIRLGFLLFSPALENLRGCKMTRVLWMTSEKIYEWMRKFICYYKNTVHSLTHILNPFVPIFLSKNNKTKKLSLVTGTDGNFRLLSDCFWSTLAEPRYCVNSPLETGKSHLHHLLVKDYYNLHCI